MFDDYENDWWDGYDGESVVLFNDLLWDQGPFLRLLMWHQVRLKVKGASPMLNGLGYALRATSILTSGIGVIV